MSSRVERRSRFWSPRSRSRWIAMFLVAGGGLLGGLSGGVDRRLAAEECSCRDGVLGVTGQPCQRCLERDAIEEPPKAGLVDAARCLEEFPRGAVPAPSGTYVGAWSMAMGREADARRAILTRNLWYDGGDRLGPDGTEKLRAVGEAFRQVPHPILLEKEPLAIGARETYDDAVEANERLNARRKAEVVEGLAGMGIAGAEDFVFLVPDRSVGVRGVEVPNVYNRQFMGGMGGRRWGSRRIRGWTRRGHGG